jgi:hypothetical protein
LLVSVLSTTSLLAVEVASARCCFSALWVTLSVEFFAAVCAVVDFSSKSK